MLSFCHPDNAYTGFSKIVVQVIRYDNFAYYNAQSVINEESSRKFYDKALSNFFSLYGKLVQLIVTTDSSVTFFETN